MRSKIFFILLGLLLFSNFAEAQRRISQYKSRYFRSISHYGEFSYWVGGGASSYFGDLKDELNLWLRPSVQLGVMYRINENFNIRGDVTWYRIAGADSLNDLDAVIRDRNLSFRADNFELSVVGIYYLYNKYSRYNEPILNPYALLGVGITTNNPKTKYQGEWHNLRKLQTEQVKYSGFQLAFPIGFGVTYHAMRDWDFSFEYAYRFTLTDYLDDASTDYPNPDSFTDPLARELSDRRDELNRTPSYTGNKYRGNPNVYDWYLITSFKVTYTPPLYNRDRYQRPKTQYGRMP